MLHQGITRRRPRTKEKGAMEHSRPGSLILSRSCDACWLLIYGRKLTRPNKRQSAAFESTTISSFRQQNERNAFKRISRLEYRSPRAINELTSRGSRLPGSAFAFNVPSEFQNLEFEGTLSNNQLGSQECHKNLYVTFPDF